VFNIVTIGIRLHTCLQSNFSVECRYRKRHYRYHGITASYLPFPRYYRENFAIPAVITVVTVILPLSPTTVSSSSWYQFILLACCRHTQLRFALGCDLNMQWLQFLNHKLYHHSLDFVANTTLLHVLLIVI